MSRQIPILPLTAEAFAPFGDVITAAGTPDAMINDGLCARFTDRARLDFAAEGRPGISLFQAPAYALPLRLSLVERHPLGSQAFLPMSGQPFLVVVAPDEAGRPGRPLAFRTAPGEGVNYHRGTWHGVLTPVGHPGLFSVIDYIGPGDNLEEHAFETPYLIGGEADIAAFSTGG